MAQRRPVTELSTPRKEAGSIRAEAADTGASYTVRQGNAVAPWLQTRKGRLAPALGGGFAPNVPTEGRDALRNPLDQTDFRMESTTFLASPNSIIVLSRKNTSFSTPA